MIASVASPAPSANGSAGGLSSSTAPVKATIVNQDKGGKPLYCMFNPKEYSFSKQNNWKEGETKGTNVPQMEFSGGKPATLQLQLFFDTYETGKDVREEYTNALWQLTLVDDGLKDAKSNKSRPPIVRFQWGKAWSFDAVITKMSQKFTLFLANGTPVRVTVDVTFQQVKDERQLGMQNPTSGGVGGTRLWTVEEGDTLAWIAYRHYGDATQWRRIADANQMSQVRRLRPGMTLEIPSA